MENSPNTSALPPDNPQRHLKHARPDQDETLPQIGMVGDTYTILLTGKNTAGRYCLIDMHVPPGGGPAPHRHDFEEMFTVLDGEIEATFRGQKSAVRVGETINIPANAPHAFTNVGVVQKSAFLGYTRRADTAGLRGSDSGGKDVSCRRRRAAPGQARWG